MIFNIFKTSLCVVLIFFSCFIADVRGKSITELEEINITEFDSSGLDSQTTKETVGEESVAVPGADNNCDRGECKTNKCNCCPGFGIFKGGLFSRDSCKECGCGKQFNCTFPGGFNINASKNTCLCGTGYTAVNERCKADCKKNPCKNGGKCILENNDFLCNCTELYAGEFCEKNICDDINCQNGGQCQVKEGNAICECLDQYTGDECQNHKCGNLTCQNGGWCNITEEKAVCECLGEYTGDECQKHICDDINCQNGGQCQVKEGKATCKCLDQYTGEECQNHKCGNLTCQNGGWCNITEVKAVCECLEEYTGDECQKHKCSLLQCHEDEICAIENGEVMCKLKGNKSPCESDPCENGGTCTIRNDFLEGFSCTCSAGFVGEKCEIDECSLLQCQDDEICVIENGDVECKITGDKNPCESHPCKNGGSCMSRNDSLEGFSCNCPTGYFGEKCETDMSTCVINHWQVSWEAAVNLCANDGSSLLCYKSWKEMDYIMEAFKLTTTDSAKLSVWLSNRNCTSENGNMEKCLSLHIQKSEISEWHFFQTNCDENYPFVCCKNEISNKCDGINCQNNGTCKIVDGNAVCECQDGYTGDECEKRSCSDELCLNGGRCFVTSRSFQCICKEPYAGKFCEINLCPHDLCRNGGTCKAIQGEAKCFCKEPYGGKFCNIRMDDCITNVCENGGICRNLYNEPQCFCMEPYGGKFCEIKKDLRNNSTIFAVVYILLGLVFISVGVLTCCLLCRRICLVKKY